MTGPEHYRRAEAILAEAEHEFVTGTGDAVTADRIATAHVHATLALAAATAMCTLPPATAEMGAWRSAVAPAKGGAL